MYAIICFPSCDVINFEINLIFQIQLFFNMGKKLRQKVKYLENEKSFLDEIIYIFNQLSFWTVFNCQKFISEVMITWSGLARMKFCPASPWSRQCYKLSKNYILRLHVKRFIPARRDPSFVQPGSRFAGTEIFPCNRFSPPRRDKKVN